MTSDFFFGGSRYREPNRLVQVQTREVKFRQTTCEWAHVFVDGSLGLLG